MEAVNTVACLVIFVIDIPCVLALFKHKILSKCKSVKDVAKIVGKMGKLCQNINEIIF